MGDVLQINVKSGNEGQIRNIGDFFKSRKIQWTTLELKFENVLTEILYFINFF